MAVPTHDIIRITRRLRLALGSILKYDTIYTGPITGMVGPTPTALIVDSNGYNDSNACND